METEGGQTDSMLASSPVVRRIHNGYVPSRVRAREWLIKALIQGLPASTRPALSVIILSTSPFTTIQRAQVGSEEDAMSHVSMAFTGMDMLHAAALLPGHPVCARCDGGRFRREFASGSEDWFPCPRNDSPCTIMMQCRRIGPQAAVAGVRSPTSQSPL